MSIGIYSITHRASGKRYIGKSVCIERRFWHHKSHLTSPVRNKRTTNRVLWSAVQKHGWDAFDLEILEVFDTIDEAKLADAEIKWMDHFRTYERAYGYNIQRDSSTATIVHEETRAIYRQQIGVFNPNYGNNWSEDQKKAMSENRRARSHKYGDEWRAKLVLTSSEIWKDEEKKRRMAEKVRAAKSVYLFLQIDIKGKVLKIWESVDQIRKTFPDYWDKAIYGVCHGHKRTYRGFIWRQVRCDERAALNIYLYVLAGVR